MTYASIPVTLSVFFSNYCDAKCSKGYDRECHFNNCAHTQLRRHNCPVHLTALVHADTQCTAHFWITYNMHVYNLQQSCMLSKQERGEAADKRACLPYATASAAHS